jgi:hypothetical protein
MTLKVLAVAQVQRRSGVVRRCSPHVAVRADERGLDGQLAQKRCAIDPTAQIEMLRVLLVRQTEHQERLIDTLEQTDRVFLEQQHETGAALDGVLQCLIALGVQ